MNFFEKFGLKKISFLNLLLGWVMFGLYWFLSFSSHHYMSGMGTHSTCTKVSEKNEQLQFSKKKVLIKNCIGWETNFFLINSTILLIRLTHRNAYMYTYAAHCWYLSPRIILLKQLFALLSLLEKKNGLDWISHVMFLL